jgi:thiamine pyrophosphate-dependent acetolactate synthase large subunit-like protein
MQDLLKRFIDHEISRRDFGKSLAALGLSAAAVESMVGAMAQAADPPPAEGVKFQGTGAEVMLETLRAANIKYIFGTTSTGMSPFFDALSMQTDVQWIMSIAESQATSMAHGYELASGDTAVLFVPGVAIPSTINNLYNAWKDRSAIAVFSDGPRIKFSGRNMFQQMDDWLQPMIQFTKWRWQVDSENQIGEMTRRAIKLAGTAPGGPVHIRYPLDLLATRNVRQTIYPQSRFTVPVEMRPKPELIEQTAKYLIEAKQPMISVGSEVTRAGANDQLVELAEMLGIPVAQGYSVYGDFPFRHPLFAGFYGLGVPRGLGGTDVFLNLGAQMPDPGVFTAPVPKSAIIIHARIEYEDIASIYPTDVAIAASLKETITDLNDAIKSMVTADRLEKISAPRMDAARESLAKRDAERRDKARKNWDASPLSWERVSAELDQALEDDAIIVPELDYRTPLRWMDIAPDRKWLVGQTTGFALGWGLGAAMGAKIAQPDRQVVCLVGDGALLFGQIESLWSAARYDIPVIIVVFNNRSYDNERNRIQAGSPLYQKSETRELWKDITGYLGDPVVDFTGLAKSFEIPGEMVQKPDELQAALKRAVAATRDGRPYLIDAIVMQLAEVRRGVYDKTEKVWYPEISIAAGRKKKV